MKGQLIGDSVFTASMNKMLEKGFDMDNALMTTEKSQAWDAAHDAFVLTAPEAARTDDWVQTARDVADEVLDDRAVLGLLRRGENEEAILYAGVIAAAAGRAMLTEMARTASWEGRYNGAY